MPSALPTLATKGDTVSRTRDLTDAAALLVQMAATSGQDIPIPELVETTGAIEDHLRQLWFVEERIKVERALHQKRVDYYKAQRHRVRQSAIGLCIAYEDLTERTEVLTPFLRASVAPDGDGIMRLRWRLR
jgi:hypothetical protein